MTTTRSYLEFAIGGDGKTIMLTLVNGGLTVDLMSTKLDSLKNGYSITLLSYMGNIIGYFT